MYIYSYLYIIFCIIVGLENAKRSLQEIVVLPALNPDVRKINDIKYYAFTMSPL